MNSKLKWNNKYKERLNSVEYPKENERLINLSHYFKGGTALDFACGLGANSLYLAKLGYEVEAYDISDVAINQLKDIIKKQELTIKATLCDLENWDELDLNNEGYDLVVMTYYLDRTIFPLIKSIVNSNGYFFMETFYMSPNTKKQGISDQYKLNSNELLTLFNDWQILFYEENEQEGRQTIFVRNSN